MLLRRKVSSVSVVIGDFCEKKKPRVTHMIDSESQTVQRNTTVSITRLPNAQAVCLNVTGIPPPACYPAVASCAGVWVSHCTDLFL